MEDRIARNRTFLDEAFPGVSSLLLPPDRILNFTLLDGPIPNIVHRGKTLHARKDPDREASNLVSDIPVRAGTVVLFLGLGLGHQVRRLKSRFPRTFGEATIIVVERSVETFSLLCAREDVSFLKDTFLFVGEASRRVEQFIEQLSALGVTGHRIVALRGCTALHPDYYRRIENFFRMSLAGKLSDLLTRFAFESLWAKNIIENLPSLVDRQSIAAFRGALRGQPALVVNAGPSLYHQLDLISDLQTRVHLIAVDTALTPLMKGGTIPDFVVTLDAGFFNTLDFRWPFISRTPVQEMRLVADMVAHPLILSHWEGAIYFSETSPTETAEKPGERNRVPFLDQFRKHYPTLPTLDCGGSISTTAIELALFMDADPVYVTGLDLSYDDYKTHVNSTALYELFARKSERFSSIDTAMIGSIAGRRRRMLPALGGGEVISDFVFSKYLHWLQERSCYRGRVTNCTARGVAISSLPHRPLDEVASGAFLPRRKYALRPEPAKILTADKATAFLNELDSALKQVRKEIDTHSDPHHLAARHQAFTSLILEAHKLYGSNASLYRYLGLLLDFIGNHVRRARTRILKSGRIHHENL
jgi:hypothetical protein